MGFLEVGAQCRLKGYSAERALNGRNCVVTDIALGVAGETIRVRFGCGRELDGLSPDTHLEAIVEDGRLEAGWRVTLAGLKAAGLNGQEGCVGEPVHSPGRALINLDSGGVKAIKFENIVLVRKVAGGPAPAAAPPAAAAAAPAPVGPVPAKAGPQFDKAYEIGTKVSILNSVDLAMHGEAAVVLGQDGVDPDRFQVRVEKSGKVMAVKRTNLTPLGGKIELDEVEVLRKPLKERFFSELRKLLWNQTEESIAIATLASETVAQQELNKPFSIWSRMWQAWVALRATYPNPPQMYDCLQEAPGQFAHLEDEEGWGVVALTDLSRQMLIREKVPEPPTKKRKVVAENPRGKLDDMARALYNAMTMVGPKGTFAHVSTIGSDVTVRNLRNDKWFGVGKKKRKIEDMLREYPEVFYLEMRDGAIMVSLTEDAEVALPQRSAGDCSAAGSGDALPSPDQGRLPDRIRPRNRLESAQALRIEIIHALHRHNGLSEVGILGQDPAVQQARKGLEGVKSTKFVDLCRIFPDNFSIVLDEQMNKWMVSLASRDVSDWTPITDWVKGKPSRAHIEARQQQMVLRARMASTGILPPDDDVENVEAEVVDPLAASQFFCHACASPVQRAAGFCGQCAAEVPAEGWLNAGGDEPGAPGPAPVGPMGRPKARAPVPVLQQSWPKAQAQSWPQAPSWPQGRWRAPPGKLPGTGLPKAQARALKKTKEDPSAALPTPLQPGLIGKGAPLERKSTATATGPDGEIIYGAAPVSEMPDPWREWRAQKRGDAPPSGVDPWADFGIYPKPKPKPR